MLQVCFLSFYYSDYDYVFCSEWCQNTDYLHSILCLNASCVDTCCVSVRTPLVHFHCSTLCTLCTCIVREFQEDSVVANRTRPLCSYQKWWLQHFDLFFFFLMANGNWAEHYHQRCHPPKYLLACLLTWLQFRTEKCPAFHTQLFDRYEYTIRVLSVLHFAILMHSK